MDKKAKAEAKRARRVERKQGGESSNSSDPPDVETPSDDEPNTQDATN